MAVRSRDFVGIAEGIKSHELSTKGKIESLKGTISELSSRKSALDNQISYLEAALSAAYEDTDEDGDPDYGRISAIESQINAVEGELSGVESQLDGAQGELSQSEAELESVMEEKAQTLFEIQERARTTSQNISVAGGMYGAYSGVGGSLQGSLQSSLASLSQAASILDGSVDGAVGGSSHSGESSGSGRTLSGDLSTGALSAFTGGTNSATASLSEGGTGISSPSDFSTSHSGDVTPATAPNFHSGQKSINPQRTLNFSSDQDSNGYALSAFSDEGGDATPVENSMFNSRQQSPQMESKFGRGEAPGSTSKTPISSALDSISSVFGKNSAKTFSGCQAKRNPYKKDVWDIVGSGYDKYSEYRANLENYTVDSSRYGSGIIKEVDVNFIEGIPSITTSEINNPQLFWGRESGKTMDTFIEIASHIPEVKERLSQGYKIEDLKNDPTLGSCASIYFDPDSPSAPTLYKGDGFYEFVGNGRHRILAARYLGYSFPMRVVGEIVNKNPTSVEGKNSFTEQLRSGNFISHNTKAAVMDIRRSSSHKELSMMAQYHNVSSNIDFGRLDLKVSQQIVESLVTTKSMFPNLNINLSFVGSIQARNQHVVQNATQKLLVHYATDYKKNNPGASREECKKYAVFQTRQKLSGLVPHDNTIAQSISISPSIGAVSESDKIIVEAAQGISINESVGYSDALFRKKKVEEVMSGHKPHGCNTAKASIDHEIGHQVANALNAANDPYIKHEFEKFVSLSRSEQAATLSTYAGEDHKIGEFLAECWSEYQNNPECRPLARNISNRMIDMYNAVSGYTPKRKSTGFDHDEPIREL